MTNTQYKTLLEELQAMRAVLERSAALAESLAAPVPVPVPADGVPALADAIVDAGGVRVTVPPSLGDVFEAYTRNPKQIGKRRGRGGGGK
jgi:hypothetical protein